MGEADKPTSWQADKPKSLRAFELVSLEADRVRIQDIKV